jgi:hypothetical protein
MKSNLTSTNVSFDFLKNSNEFLYDVINNINSCILLLNNKMELQAFNDALKTIFSDKTDEELMYQRCGEALGCAYHVEEQQDCGKTSQCNNCELRISALTSYMDDKTIYKEHIIRPFYNQVNQKVEKHLQFSTRFFNYLEEKYIILIIDDITKFYSPDSQA